MTDSQDSTGAVGAQEPIIEGLPDTASIFANRADPGFDAALFYKLAQVEATHFWFRARNRLIYWALDSYLPQSLTRGGNFLEVGCGTGFVLSEIGRRFPELVLYGCDPFVEGLSIAHERTPRATFFQADACALPFEREFDLLGAFDVIEHIDDDCAALAQFHQALRPGGGLVLTVPQHPFLWSAADEYGFHKRRYTSRALVSKVIAAGFRVIHKTSFVALLLPLMVVSRLVDRGACETFDPLGEFKLHPVANAVCSYVMAVERLLIKTGLSLPAGGSLMVIARKDF